MPSPGRTFALAVFVFCSLFVREAAADPVVRFIVQADSLAGLDDPSALRDAVDDEAVLVGAAVGQLLDIAFRIERDDPEGAAENVRLAARLAGLHAGLGGSPVPGRLVTAHRDRTPEERATKRRAQGLEAEAAEARAAGDPARDVELLREAQALYESIGDRRAVAINLGTQGVAHWYAGDWAAVESAYERALEARRAIDDHILEGRTLNGLGSVHFQQSEYEQALRWYRQAIELRERTGDRVGLATSLTYASNCEQALGRLVEARRLLERAVPVLEASGNDRRRLEALSSLGTLYSNMQRTGDAVRSYREALAMIDAAPEHEATVRLNLAGALSAQGHLREAIDEIARVETLVGDASDARFSFRLHTERGLALLALGDLDRAAEELGTARDLALEIGVPRFVVSARTNLALARANAGDQEGALDMARRALAAAREAGNPLQETTAARVAADALVALERYEEALDLTASVLERHSDLGADVTMELRVTRGNALAETGRYGAARDELRAVRSALLRTGRTELEWIPLTGIGDSFETLAPDSARAYYEAAFEALERHRAAAGSGALRTGYLATQRGNVYEGVLHFYAQQAEQRNRTRWSELAFRTAERARARGLLELVTRSFEAEDDPAIAALLDSLYTLERSESVDAQRRSRLQERLARRFDARLAETAPWLQDGGSLIGPRDLSTRLDDDTAALVYAVGTEASYLWVVDSDGHVFHELPGRSELQSRVVALREALQAPGFGDRSLAAEAHALYRTLVAPAVDRTGDRDRLWIVPDGILFEIPFEMLLTEPAGERPDWTDARYLAREVSIGYAPSATLLLQLRGQGAAAATANVLAVADPDYGSLAPRAGAEAGLPPLPETRRELDVLERLRSDETIGLVGDEATESAFRERLRIDRPSIVHLATHGLVDREEPALTSVALARDPDGGEDGYLYTLEIMALPLDTELVVLSACDTGRGKLERGEGTIGLTRAFLAAGARRVVSSLWPVADASTGRLMARFYEEMLRRDRPVAEALNRARAALWSERETAHPYYWAAFVLMGSDASVPDPGRG
jgi:CHAT domain-containing protein/Tfp pilus assembly protein PilF